MIYKIDRIHGSLKRLNFTDINIHWKQMGGPRKDMEGKMMVGGHLYKLINILKLKFLLYSRISELVFKN